MKRILWVIPCGKKIVKIEFNVNFIYYSLLKFLLPLKKVSVGDLDICGWRYDLVLIDEWSVIK